MEGAGHERVVLDRIAEHDELGAADAVPRRGEAGGLDDGSPISATASMLMPALVVPTLTEAQTRSVAASASGIDAISARRRGSCPCAPARRSRR